MSKVTPKLASAVESKEPDLLAEADRLIGGVEKKRELATTSVLIIYTGGTIGMCMTERGFAPRKGYLTEYVTSMSTFHEPGLPEFTTPRSALGKRVNYNILEYDPLLDSSNMDAKDWAKIAGDIRDNYELYDAFVILHGTDTMAYTASALSFMLENLSKPVILTGSQIPLSLPRNDGVDNLLGALTIAGNLKIPEVTLYFHNRLLRGNRSTKVDASQLEAFDSPNMTDLVHVGIHVKVKWERILSPPIKPLLCHTDFDGNVAVLRIFPGLSVEAAKAMLRPPLKGVVLQTFGAGNAPDRNKALLRALKEASLAGIVIVNCTQCFRGMVVPSYAAGVVLKEVGVVPGCDMTVECALTKLGFLLSKGYSPDEVRELMTTNLRGELTETDTDDKRFTFKDNAFIHSVYSALRSYEPHPGESLGEMEFIGKALFPVLLCSAVALRNVDEVKSMVDSGADVNSADYDGRTALHIAASEGTEEVARYLLLAGANPNAVDRWGATPLRDAVSNRHDAIIEMLKSYGGELGDYDAAGELCAAAHASDAAHLKRLVQSGCDPSSSDYDGRTALHLVASEGHAALVPLLLGLGADPMAVDRWGSTPFIDAKRNGFEGIARELRLACGKSEEELLAEHAALLMPLPSSLPADGEDGGLAVERTVLRPAVSVMHGRPVSRRTRRRSTRRSSRREAEAESAACVIC